MENTRRPVTSCLCVCLCECVDGNVSPEPLHFARLHHVSIHKS
jgi:hypothetical protein